MERANRRIRDAQTRVLAVVRQTVPHIRVRSYARGENRADNSRASIHEGRF